MSDKPWWGEYSFENGQGRLWQLAGLELRFCRQPGEWQIEVLRQAEQQEDEHGWAFAPESHPALAGARLSRHLFRETRDCLRLLPRLADRPVVIKPVNPLFIAAGQQATLFVSTPVWASAWLEGLGKPILDIPVVHPSDTWFGSSPIRGQLAYATKVFCRTELSQLPIRPFRAVTPVTILNDGNDTMPVERLCLPVPQLDLFSGTDSRLWTPGLRVERQANTRIPRVVVESQRHPASGVVKRLTQARESDHSSLGSMFDLFFD